jgi:hypothetical protein
MHGPMNINKSTPLLYPVITKVLVSNLLKTQHENCIVPYIVTFSMDYLPIDSTVDIVALQDQFDSSTSVNSKPGSVFV